MVDLRGDIHLINPLSYSICALRPLFTFSYCNCIFISIITMGSIAIDTTLPPGAWDSHVHVVDEVSLLSSLPLTRDLKSNIHMRTPSPSILPTHTAQRKPPSMTCSPTQLATISRTSALLPSPSMAPTIAVCLMLSQS
jgi:hypothetical protein